jgi:hypothetical protein
VKTFIYAAFINLVMANICYGNELQDYDEASITYNMIGIHSIESANIKYFAHSGQSWEPTYKAIVNISAIVQGNICSGDSSSFGKILRLGEDKIITIELVAGSVASVPCPMYSKPTLVNVPVAFDFYEHGTEGEVLKAFRIGDKLMKIVMKNGKAELSTSSIGF